MTQTALNQILAQLQTPGCEELEQVKRAVDMRLANVRDDHKRQMFHQALLASGLVTRLGALSHAGATGVPRSRLPEPGPRRS